MSPPRNKGKSSENPKCTICVYHFKDLDGHVLRMHGTTSNTRQERRNANFQHRNKGYIRILCNQKCSALEDRLIFEEKIRWFILLKNIAKISDENNLSIFQLIYSNFNRAKRENDDKIKRLREEVEVLRKELEKVKNKLKELEQVNNADSVLNSMRVELDQKDENIDLLTKQVSELKLVNEERNNVIKKLEDDMNDAIAKLASKEKKYKSAIVVNEKDLKERDQRETKIKILESKLGSNNAIYEIIDSDTDP
ncbi:5115_t:CDS:2 [Dentiscutata heterogama]|uniref:5115_t:CDS:1 n=1 Tax=Dentiscutata heterogama TaxID=1316150 RepID=A0ACA9LUF8_9GLOM|nr:5115_t:CDS:2 [Dentiscutata heterogama]